MEIKLLRVVSVLEAKIPLAEIFLKNCLCGCYLIPLYSYLSSLESQKIKRECIYKWESQPNLWTNIFLLSWAQL